MDPDMDDSDIPWRIRIAIREVDETRRNSVEFKSNLAKLRSSFAALAIVATTARLSDRAVAVEVARSVGRVASDPMPMLMALLAGAEREVPADAKPVIEGARASR